MLEKNKKKKKRAKMNVCEIPDTAKLITGSTNTYIDRDGSVYAIDSRPNLKTRRTYKKATRTIHGYTYCGINYEGKGNISKRVHRLVAQEFIPNPDPEKYTVVGHKNNIKNDNRVENLYWTNVQENTQKAVDDGLMKNDKGLDDSQSKPVIMFDTHTNEMLGIYGSARQASKETGVPLSTVCRQAKYKRPVRKDYYFRYIDDESC